MNPYARLLSSKFPMQLLRYFVCSVWMLSLSLGVLLLNITPVLAQGCPVSPGTPNCGETGPGDSANVTASRGVGDPIDLVTGNNYQRQVDHAPQPKQSMTDLVFIRHYSSANVRTDRALGPGWSHAYQVSLWATRKNQRQIVQSDGRRIVFTQNSNNASEFDANSVGDGRIVYERGFATWYLRDGRQMMFDANGWLERIRHPGGALQHLTYDNLGRVERITDRSGDHLFLQYYSKPDLTAYKAGRSERKQLMDKAEAIASQDRLKSVSLPDGGEYRYEYDGLSNLVRMTGPHYQTPTVSSGDQNLPTARQNVRIVTYQYDDENYPHALTGLSHGQGSVLKLMHTWRYDDQGRANHYHRAGTPDVGQVNRIDLTYESPQKSGELGKTFLTNSLGQKSTYTWRHHWLNAQSQLLTSDGPGCGTCPEANVTYQYNKRRQLTAVVRIGGKTEYRYDDQGRITEELLSTQDSSSPKTLKRYVYDDDRWLPTIVEQPSVNANGSHTTKVTYNSDGLPLTVTESGFAPTSVLGDNFRTIERSSSLTYSDGLIASIDGPRTDVNDIVLLSYDKRRRLVSMKDPSGRETRVLAHDSGGRATQIQQGNEGVFAISYNVFGDIQSVSQYGNTLRYEYDAHGNLLSMTGPDGEKIRLGYDEVGRINNITGPDGREVREVKDSEDRVTTRDILGSQGDLIDNLSRLYNAKGHLKVANINNRTRKYSYNDHDRVVKIADDGGDSREFNYGPFGQLSGIWQENGKYKIGYDNKGQRAEFTDLRDNRVRELRDDFGRLTLRISPDTGTTVFDYDKAGNQISTRGPDGNVIARSYDAAGRLLATETNDFSVIRSYGSSHGRLASVQRMAKDSDASASIEQFSYQAAGKLSNHIRIYDGKKFNTRYEYDERQRLKRKVLPDGKALRYHYYGAQHQAAGHLRAVTVESLFGLRQKTIVGEIDHDLRDGRSGLTHSNGIKTEYEFADGKLAGIYNSEASGLSLEYFYDDDGDIVEIDIDRTSRTYQYDVNGNLTVARTPDGSYRFKYDYSGNRISKSVTDNESSGSNLEVRYEYPENGDGDRLLSELDQTDSSASEKLSYNSSGSPTDSGKFVYKYDGDQRPVSVWERREGSDQKGDLVAQYEYNGFGERIKKVIYSGGTRKVTYFLYDGSRLVAEADEDGQLTKQYIYMTGHQAVAMFDGSELYAIHGDNLGTPQQMTDSDGEIVWEARYKPFGRAEVSVNKTSLNLRLPGQYEDAETGNHYNYFRDYNPDSGRYLTSDPIGLNGGLNTYAYVANNPLQLTDVLGLADSNTTATTASDKPASEGEFKSKLNYVLDNVIDQAKNGGLGDLGAQVFKDLKATAATLTAIGIGLGVVAGVAIGVTGGAATPVVVGGLAIAGATLGMLSIFMLGLEAVTFLWKAVQIVMRIAQTPCDDKAGLDALADELYKLGLETTSSVLSGLVGGGVTKIVKKLKNIFNKIKNAPKRCSFDGETLVLTATGLVAIKDIEPGVHEVWSRDSSTGQMDYQPVSAQYSGEYDETVYVTMRDQLGAEQTVVSNRIHPFFARVSNGDQLPQNSEGHHYDGPISDGYWIDAQDLKVGFELLSANESWQQVVGVRTERKKLSAFNLTVEKFNTFFVAAKHAFSAVWVHNTCWNNKPDGFEKVDGKKTDYEQDIFEAKNGEQIYKGHDGRYYSLKDHPPTPRLWTPGSNTQNGVVDPDGQSFFSWTNWFQRGKHIENKLATKAPYNSMKQTEDNFPGIDFWDESSSTVYQTFSTAARNMENAIKGKIRHFKNKLATIDNGGSIRGKTEKDTNGNQRDIEIDSAGAQNRILDVVVQKGQQSQTQLEQIERAIKYGRDNGITVRIIEVP